MHRFEAKYYELLHPEVYSRQEQKRISSVLKLATKLVENNQKKALDVGAGTGNLTGKLLGMGYRVTATDISTEMCDILRKKYSDHLKNGQLRVINSPIEEISFEKNEFDLITCYSVLHHLPDYLGAIQTLSAFLKKGGVIYIDHEASPYYWKNEPSGLASFVKDIYFHSSPMVNSVYFQIIGLNVPQIDYTLSDYWHKKEHAIDHKSIESVFRSGFEFSKRTDYHLNGTWIINPLFYVYRFTCKPEMSYWIAKK